MIKQLLNLHLTLCELKQTLMLWNKIEGSDEVFATEVETLCAGIKAEIKNTPMRTDEVMQILGKASYEMKREYISELFSMVINLIGKL